MAKAVGWVLLLVVAALIVVVRFSESVTNYDCRGSVIRAGISTRPEPNAPARSLALSFELREYRPWVHLWPSSDSDGTIMVQSGDLGGAMYFNHLQISGDSILIQDTKPGAAGGFLKISRDLWLDVGPSIFNGHCEVAAGK